MTQDQIDARLAAMPDEVADKIIADMAEQEIAEPEEPELEERWDGLS